MPAAHPCVTQAVSIAIESVWNKISRLAIFSFPRTKEPIGKEIPPELGSIAIKAPCVSVV